MPPTRPMRADARRNRDALLATAREAFLGGEADIQVDEISRRAGVAVGTLYRHFDTREALVEEVYRQEVDELCAAAGRLLGERAPDEALRRFLLLLVEHAGVSKGMAVALECIMATDSAVFADARTQMAAALDQLLTAAANAGTVRAGVSGRTVLRALGGVCGMHAVAGWEDEATRITEILFDGLRFGARAHHD